MADFAFECSGVSPERYGAAPTLLFRLCITESGGAPIHAMALRCQIRIEPRRRRYSETEAEPLLNLFGDRPRWGDTLRPIQFANESVMVPSFTGSTEIDVPVVCSYDLDVAAGQYLHALSDDVVPMVLLFSGTVFGKGRRGFWVEQIPWSAEADCRMPVTVWRQLMDLYFPDSGWLRLRRDTVDNLLRYKARHGLATWDDAMGRLLAVDGVPAAQEGR